MTAKNDLVETVWDEFRVSDRAPGITGKRAPGLPADRPVYLAIDERGARHVLVPLQGNGGDAPRVTTRGLRVSTEDYAVAGRPVEPFLDLVCIDEAQVATFVAVTRDILDSIKNSDASPTTIVALALERWRLFWRSDSRGLSSEQVLGLFGELWFLKRWLADWSAQTVAHWTAPSASRHDFQWPLASVEVKTSASGSGRAPVHHIASVDQLEAPETGDLYLFSLQVVEDSLSANTLGGIVGDMTAKLLSDKESLSQFNAKLAGWGYTPADESQFERRFRIISERLYRVDGGFPRLSRRALGDSLANGVTDITYSVDMAACAEWLLAQKPSDYAAVRLRSLTVDESSK
jgi:hypothetical protein